MDFGLYDNFHHLVNLEILSNEKSHKIDKRELQILVSNMISEMDKRNKDAIHRPKIEALIYECSYKFIVNVNFNI